MANITPVTVFLTGHEDRKVRIVTWAPMLNGDVGLPVDMPGLADRSVQLTGTLGAGGNCKIEGSNMDANSSPTYALLNDPQGNALDMVALKIEQILEVTRIIRPRVSAGDGTTSLTVTLLIRG